MKLRISFLVIVLIFITTYDVTEATCAASKFECADGTCIQSAYRCDDSFECSDRSDEENCTVVQPCVEGLHQCSSGECVANINDCPLTSEIQTTIAPSQGQPSDDSRSGLEVGIIIGSVLFVVLFISIVLIVLIYVYKRNNRESTAQVAPTNHQFVSHDVKSVSHDVKSVSHDVKSVSHDVKSVSHDVKSVSHDVKSVSHDVKSVS